MKYFLLFYEFVDGYTEKRGPHRQAHLELIDAAYERGDLLLAGAYGESPKGAALLFRVSTPAEVEAFAVADPYVRNGLVLKWRIEPWHVVVGDGAAR